MLTMIVHIGIYYLLKNIIECEKENEKDTCRLVDYLKWLFK